MALKETQKRVDRAFAGMTDGAGKLGPASVMKPYPGRFTADFEATVSHSSAMNKKTPPRGRDGVLLAGCGLEDDQNR
jgi:hypothetical protein